MKSDHTAFVSKKRLYAGRIMSGIAVAILLTGYIGGAVASQLRIGTPLFSHTLFPIYVAALVWGGLYLRDSRVRALIAPRAS